MRRMLFFVFLMALVAPTTSFTQQSELDKYSTLIDQGKIQDAERSLQIYVRSHPNSSRANNLLGVVYFKQQRFDEAEGALKKAIAAAPSRIEPRVHLAEAYQAAGKNDLALSTYQDAARVAPSDSRVNFALAKIYLDRREFAHSLEAAERIPPEKRPTELLPTLAADYFGLSQPEKAQIEVRAMLELGAKYPDLLPELSEFFIAEHDFQSAEKLLTLALEKQSRTERISVDLALAQAGLGRLNEAQTTIEKVLEHKPDSVPALIAAGQVATRQLEWDAAIEAYTRAASLAPQRPDVLYGLVSAQLHTMHPEDALKNAQKLESMAPLDARIDYVLALAYFGARKPEDSRKYAEQVLKIHPEDREMHLVLADIALNSDRNAAAAHKHADLCLQNYPNDPGALYYLGMAQRMEGDVNGAIQSLSKSVTSNSKNADAQGALGSLALQANDVTQAVQALEQAVALAPDRAQFHYELALGYSRSGATDKAKAELDVYKRIKTKEDSDAKNLKQPATSEIPHMAIGSRP